VAAVAQTNLQLYNQLSACGWDDGDFARVRDTYVLACDLFSGMIRPTGKPFVAHLVGTASALVAVDERPAVVAAGLLHAAYDLGEFGDATHGMTDAKRATVRASIGTEIEELVAAYTRFPWGPQVAADLDASAATFDGESRDVLVMRLANEVDEWTDAGIRFAPRAGAMETVLESLVTLADRVDQPELGRQLRDLSRENAEAVVPEVLVSAAPGSYSVPPRSLRPRLEIRFRRLPSDPRVVPARRAVGRMLRRMGWKRPPVDSNGASEPKNEEL
jgi:(p)ppGpp synthase/HD superfamily hydrolase